MASFLHKVGTVSYRRKWSVLAVWLVLIAALGFGAVNLSKPLDDTISIPGTPAQKAITELGETFKDSGQGSGRIVYHVSAGSLADKRQAIEAEVASLSKEPGVAAVISPFLNPEAISKDGQTGYAQVQLDDGQVSKELSERFMDSRERTSKDGLQAELSSGLIVQSADGILGPGEVTGVLLALLVLAITFGAFIAAGMPIVNALLAVAASMAGLFTVSHFGALNSTTPVLAVMLGLAVGIDYSLFILSKYRTLLLQGYGYQDAAGRAIGTAGNAVLFAAATVIIALGALSVVRIPFMTAMGLAAAATIAVAALVAITITPAFMGMFGKRVFGRKTAAAIKAAQAKGVQPGREVRTGRIWGKWVDLTVKHPIAIAVPIIAVLLIASIPTFKLDLGLPGDQTAASDSTQRKAYDLLTKAFGPGYNAPLTLLVKNLPESSPQQQAAATQQLLQQFGGQQMSSRNYSATGATTPGKQGSEQPQSLQQTAPTAPTTQSGDAQQQMTAEQQAAMQANLPPEIKQRLSMVADLASAAGVASSIAKQANIQSATPAAVTKDKKTAIIQVIPKSAPNDVATADLITDIRDNPAKYTGNGAINVQVTGATALEADVNHKLLTALPQYLAVVVGLSLILLMVAFRSILIPIKATLGFLLSVGVMFGSVVAFYQWGWLGLAEGAPIVSFIPIIAIGILFGLAMDYEFFLVSGMREAYQHAKHPDARLAIVQGFKHGGKVVAAAATIMVFVFAGFIGSHNEVIRPIGFGLALGIFVDAFIVRMTLVPAIMSLLGKSAWWLPRWLDRRLPNVSIEGEK